VARLQVILEVLDLQFYFTVKGFSINDLARNDHAVLKGIAITLMDFDYDKCDVLQL
jgi:hypothetical protein